MINQTGTTARTAEHWRQAGFELVMRYGSAEEIVAARARLKDILAIQRQTIAWMRERWAGRAA